MVLLKGKAGEFTVLLCVLHMYDTSGQFSFYEHTVSYYTSVISGQCFIKLNSQTSLAMSSLSKAR